MAAILSATMMSQAAALPKTFSQPCRGRGRGSRKSTCLSSTNLRKLRLDDSSQRRYRLQYLRQRQSRTRISRLGYEGFRLPARRHHHRSHQTPSHLAHSRWRTSSWPARLCNLKGSVPTRNEPFVTTAYLPTNLRAGRTTTRLLAELLPRGHRTGDSCLRLGSGRCKLRRP
jgi:hypothetical protein